MKLLDKGNLIALLFVSAFAGDLALANELETKPGTAELAAEVRTEIELSKHAFYRQFYAEDKGQKLANVQRADKWKNSIYFPIVPKARTVAHRF